MVSWSLGQYNLYYKVRADGTVGVRVDKPDTDIFDCSWPRSSADWKELGNKFIKVRVARDDV